MTCIVAITDGHNVWMGADSAGVDSVGNVFLKTDPKVWHAEESKGTLIGVSGPQRLRQALQCFFVPPPIQEDDIYMHMIGIFVQRLRDCLREDKQLLQKDGVEEMDGHMLVGLRGRIFMVDTRFGVIEQSEAYAGIGCGAPEARGALWALHAYNADSNPQVALIEALAASERFNAEVRRPFTIISTCMAPE